MATAPPPPPSGLQQSSPLDFDTTSEWIAWITPFDDYRYASGRNERSEEAQVRTLLYTMGRQARDIFVTFNLSAEDSKTFELVKKEVRRVLHQEDQRCVRERLLSEAAPDAGQDY
ncbi:hypothetical protein MRX96_024600 [Rhipicephalus microplus]